MRIEHKYEEANSAANKVAKGAEWLLSKIPGVGPVISGGKALMPTPSQVALVKHGIKAVEQKLDHLNIQP